jgi:hypothetical protein
MPDECLTNDEGKTDLGFPVVGEAFVIDGAFLAGGPAQLVLLFLNGRSATPAATHRACNRTACYEQWIEVRVH